ncbi:SpvB/TcaC N-terminal domain-containing protein [Loktanella agnita]|uniref:SpvB/TcaC N-terminal domain-containing protein n=1 Tax=Loktanella agnita TaxID=287097 RepID=UPI003989C344
MSFTPPGARGSATLAIPLPVPTSRDSDLSFSLIYDSSSGNGPFGIGWHLDLPSVSRSLAKGLPRYRDDDLLSCNPFGNLVQKGAFQGEIWVPDQVETVDSAGKAWVVRQFLPQSNIYLPQIERWSATADPGDVHWRARTKDNTVMTFGQSPSSRLTDPHDATKIARWLIDSQEDAKGNLVEFQYIADAQQGARVPAGQATANYIDQIRYGNYLDNGDLKFAYTVQFDYGQFDLGHVGQDLPTSPNKNNPWLQRQDQFSDFGYGFNLLTSRLCQNVLVFHHFPGVLDAKPVLTKALRLTYDESPLMSQLASASTQGYQLQAGGNLLAQIEAPRQFSYREFRLSTAPRFQQLKVQNKAGLPGAIADGQFQLIDLYGEGVPGFLESNGNGTRYYAPLGGGYYTSGQTLSQFPDFSDLSNPKLNLGDVNGDGRLELVNADLSNPGYFQQTEDGKWSGYTALPSKLSVQGAQTFETVDINGNGMPDLVNVGQSELSVYRFSLKSGYVRPLTAARPEGFPTQSLASESNKIVFANVFGDGRSHRVLIEDGRFAVWPNLGNGNFGPAFVFANSPEFPVGTNVQGQVYLADIDGSGTTDVVLVNGDQLLIYMNQSGQGFAEAQRVDLPFCVTPMDQVSFADILGIGSTSLIFTQVSPEVTHWFIDLARAEDGQTSGVVSPKPYLVTSFDNGIGQTNTFTYRSSAQSYLADKRAGRARVCRLPFVVQTMAKTRSEDAFTGASRTQSYEYHDGYYDPQLRQFQGFAYIEDAQAQTFKPFKKAKDWPIARLNADLAPQTRYERVWYDVGSYYDRAALTAQLRAECYQGDPDQAFVPASKVSKALLAEAPASVVRQAFGALAGRETRREHYNSAQDAEAGAAPLLISQHNSVVQGVQPYGPEGYGSLLIVDVETLEAYYEQGADDPRLEHSVALASTVLANNPDAFYTETTAKISYPRRLTAPNVLPEQREIGVSFEVNTKARVEDSDVRLIGQPFETIATVVGRPTAPQTSIYTVAELRALFCVADSNRVAYGADFSGSAPQSMPISMQQTCYWNDAQTKPLKANKIASRALEHHSREAVFSEAWVSAVFGSKITAQTLRDVCGFEVDANKYWWRTGQIKTYFGPGQPEKFFQLRSQASASTDQGLFARRDQDFDSPFSMFVTSVETYVDPVNRLSETSTYDYQALQVRQTDDPNGNVTQHRFWPLGDIMVTSRFKPARAGTPRVGDGDLDHYQPVASPSLSDIVAHPAKYLQDASSFTFPNYLAAVDSPAQPVSTAGLQRSQYVSANQPAAFIQTSVSYVDADGNEMEEKLACEPEASGGPVRWRGNKRVVAGSTGAECQRYFAYYSDTPAFQDQQQLAKRNLVPAPKVFRHDALGRVIKTIKPKGYLSLEHHHSWQFSQFDENDSLLDAPYYIEFQKTYPKTPTPQQKAEKAVLDAAVAFYNTPSVALLGPGGQPVRKVACNLGAIDASLFDPVVSGTSITAQALWDELVAQGYLETLTHPKGTWVSDSFQPYVAGFSFNLPAPYAQFEGAVKELLTQNRLTTKISRDWIYRVVGARDPRLFLAEVSGGQSTQNVTYQYPMGSDEALFTDSCDAGPRWQLKNALGHLVLEFDAVGQSKFSVYDGLGKMVERYATDATGKTRLAIRIDVALQTPAEQALNRAGEIASVRDGSGILQFSRYGISRLTEMQSRQFLKNPAKPVDWTGTPKMAGRTFETEYAFNALGQVERKELADATTITRDYWPSNRLKSVTVASPGQPPSVLISDTSYTAANEVDTVSFGQGIVQTRTYEDTTERTIALDTVRPSKLPGGGTRDPKVQSMRYMFDPAGNLAKTWDRTANLLFCGGTEPENDAAFGYDALYRLISASGLQHPGIKAETHATGFMQSLYAELCPAGTPPITLERYTDTFTYDASGNMVEQDHQAASESFTRNHPVEDMSNRIKGLGYDDNGNALSIDLEAATPIGWNESNSVAHVGPITLGSGAEEANETAYDYAQLRAWHRITRRAQPGGSVAQTTTDFTVDALVSRQLDDAARGTSTVTNFSRIEEGPLTLAVTETLSPASGGPEQRIQLVDRLGSVSVEMNLAGDITSYEAYFPFGGTAVIAGSDKAVVSQKRVRYSNKSVDENTGLYDYGARMYPTWQGRWINPDPAGTTDGLNLYQFVGNNPMTLIDPDGMCKNGPTSNQSSTNRRNGFLGPDQRVLAEEVMEGLLNEPFRTFIGGPRLLGQLARIIGTTKEQDSARQDTAGFLNELHVATYLAAGHLRRQNPDAFWSPAMTYVPRPSSMPAFARALDFAAGPASYATWMMGYNTSGSDAARLAGSTLGGLLVNGIGGVMATGLFTGTIPSLIRGQRFSPRVNAAIFVGGFALGIAGMLDERHQNYLTYRQEQDSISSWTFWRRNNLRSAIGFDRLLTRLDLYSRQRERAASGVQDAALVGLAALGVAYLLYGDAAAARAGRWMRDNWHPPSGGSSGAGRSGGSGGTGNAVAQQFRRLVQQHGMANVSRMLGQVGGPNTGLASWLLQMPSSSTMSVLQSMQQGTGRSSNLPVLYNPGQFQLALPRVEATGLQLFRRRITAPTVPRPQPTALAPIEQVVRALVQVRPRPTAMQLVPPIMNQVVPYRPPVGGPPAVIPRPNVNIPLPGAMAQLRQQVLRAAMRNPLAAAAIGGASFATFWQFRSRENSPGGNK